METEQRIESRSVSCPKCEERVEIPVTEPDVDLTVSPYLVAFGDYTEVECSNEHPFWVYHC